MVASITINPVVTTNAAGSFVTASDGGVQGLFLDDPAVRFALRSGYVLSTETLPMWGGVAIFEDIPTPGQANPLPELQSPVGRATSITGTSPITAITVFNQAHNMLNSPQSPVPLAGTGMTVNYFRLGSGARIHVAIDPALVTLEGGLINQQVSWDFALQRVIPFVAAYGAVTFGTLSWGTAGGGTVTGTTTGAHGITVGSDFTVSGVVPAAYNGTFTALAGTTGSTIVWALPAASTPGTVTTLGTINAGGGAFPCKINRIDIGNSMVVSFNAATGFATWNRSGATCEVQI